MSEQLFLIRPVDNKEEEQKQKTGWVDELWLKLDPDVHQEVVAILAEMGKTAMSQKTVQHRAKEATNE
ncbi:MAG: hypothetical protein P8Y03_28395 [Anaerolineales bacterium]